MEICAPVKSSSSSRAPGVGGGGGGGGRWIRVKIGVVGCGLGGGQWAGLVEGGDEPTIEVVRRR